MKAKRGVISEGMSKVGASEQPINAEYLYDHVKTVAQDGKATCAQMTPNASWSSLSSCSEAEPEPTDVASDEPPPSSPPPLRRAWTVHIPIMGASKRYVSSLAFRSRSAPP